MIENAHPVLQALLASLLTWGVTALGAASVFILPAKHLQFLDISLGFAAGIMTAASFWSLLEPSIEMTKENMGALCLLPVGGGFALGAIFVMLTDAILSKYVVSIPYHQHPSNSVTETSIPNILYGPSAEHERLSSWRRMLLLIIAVTVHNIPEGLAVGVSWGSSASGKEDSVSHGSSFNLALAIAIHNFPEGMMVSLPLAGFGMPKWKAFLFGQFSGMVEVITAVIGAAAIMSVENIVPYALSFPAGAMIYVVFDDIMPEAHKNNNKRLVSISVIIGFMLMMCLEVGLEHGHSHGDHDH